MSDLLTKIIMVNSVSLPEDVKKYLLRKYNYDCNGDHAFLQVINDGNLLAQWLIRQGYKFKHEQPKSDLIALYGNDSDIGLVFN